MSKIVRDFNSPDGNEIVPDLQIRQRFLPPAPIWKVGELKASSDLQIWHYFTFHFPLDPRELGLTESVEFAPHTEQFQIHRFRLFSIFSKNFNGAVKCCPKTSFFFFFFFFFLGQSFLNFSPLAPARQVAFNFRVVTPGCCDTGATWAKGDVGYRMLVNGYNSCVSSLSSSTTR